ADYNKDGNLDVAVSDFHPTHFNFLFLGDGQGGFTEDAASPFALSATSAVGIAWGDYDNDGDPDLFVANTNGENNQLFRNDNGLFTALDSGVVVTDAGHSVGGTWGDYDNDGDLDLYVTNSQVFEANFFYENDGDGTFTKITNNEVVNHPSNSHGASWIDFDNDGDLDLLVANNQNSQNHLFSNHGDGTFSSIANAITSDLNDSYGTAWSDYDNDGDYDLFVANIGANANDFFVNQKGSCTNHIVVKLSGCNSNSFGIGAMVKVKATIGGTPTWQTKHVSTQTSALAGQNSPKLLFGLLDATTVDSVIVIWPSGIVSTLTNVTLNSLLTVDEPCGAKVCGVVYYDANGNQVRDNGEPGIPNQLIRVTPGNFQVYTNDSGEYQFYAEDGVYTIDQEPGNNWVQSYPLLDGDHSVTVNQASQTEYCGRDFGNTPVCSDPELNVQVGTSAFRRGLTNQLLVAVVNESAFDAQAGITLEVALSDNVYLVDGGHQSVVENGGIRTYTYALDSILALRDTVLHLIDSVDNAAAIDAPVTVDVTVTYLATECDTTDNTASFADVVVGSIDPNDKQVFVGSRGVQTKAAQSDLLTYRVRFQNIGNYAARIVTIRDTLSPYLDWDSFQFLGASHPFDYQVVNGVITFRNNNIELPDSASDPEGSMGYVLFGMRLKAGIGPYTVVRNIAHIQFDRNDWIETNAAEVLITPEDYTRGTRIQVYPNPAHRLATAVLLDKDSYPLTAQRMVITNLQGTVMKEQRVFAEKVQLDLSDLMPGFYLISLESTDGAQATARLIVGANPQPEW
ncbi:MAG: FG-GAP-like repeat-containing protein, partial [Bacteroidota bacterium]